MAILTVPKVLREKLGDEGVEALIALLNEAAHHERNNLLDILTERFERRVTEEGRRLDKRITEEVARLEVLLTETENQFFPKEEVDSRDVEKNGGRVASSRLRVRKAVQDRALKASQVPLLVGLHRKKPARPFRNRAGCPTMCD